MSGTYKNFKGTRSDTFEIGDGAGDKEIIANISSMANKPKLKYDATNDVWKASHDGENWEIIGASIAARGAIVEMFRAVPASTQSITSSSFAVVPGSALPEQTFVIAVAGTYNLHIEISCLCGTTISTAYEAEFQAIIDESDYNGFTEQILGDTDGVGTAGEWAMRVLRNDISQNAYASKTLQRTVTLEAGTHKVVFQAKAVTDEPRVAGRTTVFAIVGQLVAGSGAGGTIVQELVLASDFTITDSYISPTYVDVPDAEFTVTTYEGEWVQLTAAGYMIPPAIAGALLYIRWEVDSGDSYVPAATGYRDGASGSTAIPKNFSHTAWVQLSAGTHVIQVQVAKNTTGNPDMTVEISSGFWVTQFRGGLVPYQQDSVDVIDTPRAVNVVHPLEVTSVSGKAVLGWSEQISAVRTSAFTAAVGINRVDISGGSFTTTLPTAASAAGQSVKFLVTDMNAAYELTVDGDSAETIDGALVAYVQMGCPEFYSDGTAWHWLKKGQMYVDRGDPSAWDFDETDMSTRDGSWNDLSLTSILPNAAYDKLVRLSLYATAVSSALFFQVRRNGDTQPFDSIIVTLQSDAGGDTHIEQGAIRVGAAGSIEYNTNANTGSQLLYVKGWWVDV